MAHQKRIIAIEGIFDFASRFPWWLRRPLVICICSDHFWYPSRKPQSTEYLQTRRLTPQGMGTRRPSQTHYLAPNATR